MNLSGQMFRALATREQDFVSATFGKYKKGEIIPKLKIQEAFADFKICDQDEIQHFITECEKILEDSDGLTFDEYIEVLQTPSLLEQWSQSVPLWRLLASAIPRKMGVSESHEKKITSRPLAALCNLTRIVQVDQLKVVSELSSVEISEICVAFSAGLQCILKKAADDLKDSLYTMDLKSKTEPTSMYSKFEICAMNSGSIKDFHHGLAGRIGTPLRPLRILYHPPQSFFQRRFTEC
jgi:hypothetical protein